MSRENQADSSTNQTTPGQAGADFCPCQDQPKDDASSACLAQTPEPAEVSQQPAEAETFDQESPGGYPPGVQRLYLPDDSPVESFLWLLL